MPYTFVLENFGKITCDTIDELRAAAREYAGLISGPEVVVKRGPGRPRKPGSRRSSGKSPGSGPARSWALAQWYGLQHDKIPHEARPIIAKMKAEQMKKFLDLKEEFDKFVKWYGAKIKVESLDDIIVALRTLYENDFDAYKKVFDEYGKRPKKGTS